VATLAARIGERLPSRKTRTSLAYWALLLFTFLYYARPEDFIPAIAFIPVGKISGGIALLALIGSWGRVRVKLPLEIKVLLLLFVDLCATIPFAYWRGGAFDTVINGFSKAVIVALLISLIVSTVDELKRLLFVQAASMALMTGVSLALHPGDSVRLMGALGGVFSNPNDLAINIAINFPLCLAFFLAARGGLKKSLWLLGIFVMLYGVIATYSRSGFLAMVTCLIICIFEFGIKGKRAQIVLAGFFLFVGSAGIAVVTPHYTSRLASIFDDDVEGAGDHGSIDARRELLRDSVELTIHNPIVGVGPGNFPAVTQSWHVAHNTYTELSAEAGLPALFLFLTFLALAFRNLRRMRKSPGYKANPQIRLFTSALWASLAAYMVGAAFADTEYSLFPYFMVAYTSALYRIGASYESDDVPAEKVPNPLRGGSPWLDRLRWNAPSLAKQSYTTQRTGKC
jgi:O-antigen ligase